jgi:hypothetical protein
MMVLTQIGDLAPQPNHTKFLLKYDSPLKVQQDYPVSFSISKWDLLQMGSLSKSNTSSSSSSSDL